jgi:hypothetical protein
LLDMVHPSTYPTLRYINGFYLPILGAPPFTLYKG